MWGSAIVYSGAVFAAAGLALAVKPIRRLRVATRARGLIVAAAGVVLAAIGLILPVTESRVGRAGTRIDEFAPAWQFHEVHTIRIALATMNFLVRPDGDNGSEVSTETRVFASGAAARRRFAAYWRTIYPGSAMIRRGWLRAIERRATGPDRQ